MKLKQTYETETYISESGYYVIKQDSQNEDAHLVFLSPDQLRMIIDDMQAELSSSEHWWKSGRE